MSKQRRKHSKKVPGSTASSSEAVRSKSSSGLYDRIERGREYNSLIGLGVVQADLRTELGKAIAAVEAVRKRPLVVYAANSLRPLPGAHNLGIVAQDNLPFAEMIDRVATGGNGRSVDLFIESPGGSGDQVAKFVRYTRERFDDVSTIVANSAMSAATLWALAAEEIIMDERATLGPIDPQVPGRNGGLYPAQSVLRLIEKMRVEGEVRLRQGQPPAWTDIEILRQIEAKEIALAHSSTDFIVRLAVAYIRDYKFKNWTCHRSTGEPVSSEEKDQRATEIARMLADHGVWNLHSHGISREVARNRLKLHITPLEGDQDLLFAVRALWALLYWIFDVTDTVKVLISSNYSMFKGNKSALGRQRQ